MSQEHRDPDSLSLPSVVAPETGYRKMRKIVLLTLIGFILMGLMSTASAWDGKRKGVVLGFGIGTGITSFIHKIENICNDYW